MKPRECFEELERYIENKYADLLALTDEIPCPPNKVQRLMNQVEKGMSTEQVEAAAQKLNTREREAFRNELRLYVSNEIGNLIETYRYESIGEGELLEKYLDSLLELAGTHTKKETVLYPSMPYLLQVAEGR